jgi:hypothetical protein
VRYEAKPDGRVWLKLEPQKVGVEPRGYRWNVGLTDAVPLKLSLDGGAANANVDLTDLKATEVRVKTGASSTVMRLPRTAGLTTVRISAGAASVKLIVPEGVGAYCSSMAIGSNDIDQHVRAAAATMSRRFDAAENRSIFN